MVISFERTKSLSYFYRVFTYHSALSPAGVRHSESCFVGEDQRSVYDSNYLAIRLTNLPVFSFQSVPFSWEPFKSNGETFFAVFNFHYMVCSSTLPNMRRPYRSFKKEGRRVFFFFFSSSSFFLSFGLHFSNISHMFLSRLRQYCWLFRLNLWHLPQPVVSLLCPVFLPKLSRYSSLFELFLGFPRGRTIDDCGSRGPNGDPSISLFVGDCAYRICVEQISPLAFHTGSLSFRFFFSSWSLKRCFLFFCLFLFNFKKRRVSSEEEKRSRVEVSRVHNCHCGLGHFYPETLATRPLRLTCPAFGQGFERRTG